MASKCYDEDSRYVRVCTCDPCALTKVPFEVLYQGLRLSALPGLLFSIVPVSDLLLFDPSDA